MKQMLVLMLAVACLVVGCKTATPPVAGYPAERETFARENPMERFAMDNGTQRRLITRCDNDAFCFRKPVYDVSWVSWEQTDCGHSRLDCGGWDREMGENYPVSYRSNEYVYVDDPNGYDVALPAGGNVMRLKKVTKGRDAHE